MKKRIQSFYGIIFIVIISMSCNNSDNQSEPSKLVSDTTLTEIKNTDTIKNEKPIKIEKKLNAFGQETEKINENYYLKDNLNSQTFRNGDKIKLATTKGEWLEACHKGLPVCCYYNFDIKSENIGLLYNYNAFINNRNLAPKGFRLLNENDELPNNLTIKTHGGTFAGQAGKFFGKNEFTLFWSLCINGDPSINKYCFWKILPEDNPIFFEDFPECQGMFIRCIKE